jgi:nicotinic acid mononucleotide adenylyltransferase
MSENNTIIFSIARMNPPTPGHLLLIRKLIEQAIIQNVTKVYVILSKTDDNNENPIICPEKIIILNNMVSVLKAEMQSEIRDPSINPSIIDRVEVIFICVDPDPELKATPISTLYYIVQSYIDQGITGLKLFMIIGDDRGDFLDTLVESFLFKMPYINYVNGQILERENMAQYKNSSLEDLSKPDIIQKMPVSAFSASFVRKLVNFKLKDQFNKVYKKYLSPAQIEYLYNIISKGLKKPNPKVSSSSSVVTELKYEYPVERGKGNFNTYYAEYEAEQLKKARLKAIKDAEKEEKARLKAIKDAEKAAEDVKKRPAATKRKPPSEENPDAGGSRKRKLTKRRKTKRRKTKRRKCKRLTKRRRHYR